MTTQRLLATVSVLVVLGGLVATVGHWGGALTEEPTAASGQRGKAAGIAVETAPVQIGPMTEERIFSGGLEAHSEFVVAPKIAGRLTTITADLGDPIARQQEVARLDDDEFVQDLAQADADLQVVRAELLEARSLLEIAERELQRIDQLGERGLSSASQRDTAQADVLARKARVSVAEAELARAKAALEGARIRLGYTRVRAAWEGGSDTRVVAERYLDDGETVAANAPLLRIVELDPITAVFYVTERHYGLLATGQAVSLATDAYPDADFRGSIRRISPVFRADTRQARVEVEVANPAGRLKPGMFVRARVVLRREEQAVQVPAQAIQRRDDSDGVFVVTTAGDRVRWQPVRVGLRSGDTVQVSALQPGQAVVVLGQQQLDDDSLIRVVEETP